MEIRKIEKADYHLVTDLFDRYRRFYQQPPDKLLAETFIRERLENNESVIFLAVEQDGDRSLPLGFTQLYPTFSSVRAEKNWILNDLYVDPEHRRKGVGETLIRAAMQFAKEHHARYVQLETAIDNFSAQSLYETIGFEKQQPDTGFFTYRINIAG